MTALVLVLIREHVILIHTSVKLVTIASLRRRYISNDFNPHEREARDSRAVSPVASRVNFNPHEREARDQWQDSHVSNIAILIHTSVKLVTEDPRR